MDSPPQGHDDPLLRARAIHNLRRKQAYLLHRNIYLVAGALMIVIWLSTAIAAGDGAWFPWPIFPIAGWGIGVFFHRQATRGPSISEADIQGEIRRLRGEI